MFRKRRLQRYRGSVDPDEVFLDAKNLPDFNTQQFEGVIERPIAKITVQVMSVFFVLVMILFLVRLGVLQIARGQAYFAESEENRLHQVTIFSERGVIYDRNEVELAWNMPGPNDEPFSYRDYYDAPGFAHVLGFVRYPKKDDAGFFWRLELEGADGVEKLYDDVLSGNNGLKLLETNALLQEQSASVLEPPVDGENVHLTIDARIQEHLAAGIQEMIEQFNYEGGVGVMMDVTNGDIIALTSLPEFNSEVLSLGEDSETISGYFNDPRNPSLNRVTNGLYTPGSTVKPFLALGMLEEGVVTPQTTVSSTGRLEIPNPWDPENPSIFRDWRPAGHGTTDIYHAIADSVNTFFYVFSGGYEGRQGIGIAGINKYADMFKLGQPTGIDIGTEISGVVPNPEWKEKVFTDDGTWRLGDTYNTSIGQFGFQVTPIQMVRGIAAIANDGLLLQPHILPGDIGKDVDVESVRGISPEHYQVVQDAMRQTVTEGTGQTLNVPYVHIAAKTGTAQTDGNRKVNAWSVGFFPYENPKYAFVVMMERGPTEDTVGSSYAVRKLLDWMNENTPEYFAI